MLFLYINTDLQQMESITNDILLQNATNKLTNLQTYFNILQTNTCYSKKKAHTGIRNS